MKKLTLCACAFALLLTITGCKTADTNENPPIRPTGSGGRGESPGYRAETSSTDPSTRR
jgi:hypothetical protein